jgi:threonine dehydrogenase-like Zn-dependent dehydrogenase
MLAPIITAVGHVSLEDIPIPDISDDDVLVESKWCGICGTELHAIQRGLTMEPGTRPGHEFAGVIVEKGKNVKRWKVGDRVAVGCVYVCNECCACKQGLLTYCELGMHKGSGTGPENSGGYSKYTRIETPDQRLCILPKEVSFEEGALIEPLAASLHPIRLSSFRGGDRVMVTGCGPVGLGTIGFLKWAGAGLIIATEIRESRARMAKRFGADYVFNPNEKDLEKTVKKLTDSCGVDQLFECSGIPAVFQSAPRFIRPGGQMIQIGAIEDEVTVRPHFFFQLKALSFFSTWGFTMNDFAIVAECLKNEVAPFRELITSKIKTSEIIEKGFNKLLQPDHNEIKILVSPE